MALGWVDSYPADGNPDFRIDSRRWRRRLPISPLRSWQLFNRNFRGPLRLELLALPMGMDKRRYLADKIPQSYRFRSAVKLVGLTARGTRTAMVIVLYLAAAAMLTHCR